jgi:small subunit ribosomal protein S20
MPNIKSAKKKMRQDAVKTKRNASYEKAVKETVKALGKTARKSADQIKKAYSVIDKAVKKKVMHKNKAARLKSTISRSKSAK